MGAGECAADHDLSIRDDNEFSNVRFCYDVAIR